MEGLSHPGHERGPRVRDAVSADHPVPAPEPRREPAQPDLEELVRAARQRRPEAVSTSTPSVPLSGNPIVDAGAKAGLIAGIGVVGAFALTIAGSVAAMWGISKVMHRVGDFVAGPIVKGILNLGKLNPFKKAWNRFFGGDGSHGSDHHDHGHGHGGGHAPAHGHH